MEKIVVRQLFRNLDRYANQVVELNGWVRNNRAHALSQSVSLKRFKLYMKKT